MHRLLAEIQSIREEWTRVSGGRGRPTLVSHIDKLGADLTGLTESLGSLLTRLRPEVRVAQGSWPLIVALLSDLDRDEDFLRRMPRLVELSRSLTEYGVDSLLDQGMRRGLTPEEMVAAFDASWNRSVVDAAMESVPAYRDFHVSGHDDAITRFRTHDREHLRHNRQRVLDRVRRKAETAMETNREQARKVRHYASLVRPRKTVRDLVHEAPELLSAVTPCWAMSPLVVSQVLPQRRLFDVVIFDEASQVPPADAMPSIMRGSQVVVAGDEHQLPPTKFFVGQGGAEEEQQDAEDVDASDKGHESVLGALLSQLQWGALTWHYRSRDDRLIAFSNHAIYDGSLTTFPGVEEEGAINFEHVDPGDRLREQHGSAMAEAERVVQLILEHARLRPTETLGVIAMGREHADRIDDELLRVRSSAPELDGFFDESAEEPFFVKNLERVQGDERDAIILSVGYGKTLDGRMRYNFGPLNRDGGQRRLNVAVTRAKRRMTVVSSFTSADMDPDRLHNEGAKLLSEYLNYAQHHGKALGLGRSIDQPLNPFESDVKNRLEAAGIPLLSQYGVSSYRIDFVAKHPQKPGALVLAIEADGASYHSAKTARDRDRLRQEHLERLGWTFHRIWSTAWFRDPDEEVRRVQAAYSAAVEAWDRDHTNEPRSIDPVEDEEWSPETRIERMGQRGGQPQGGRLQAEKAAKTPQFDVSADAGDTRNPALRPNFTRGQEINSYSSHTLTRLVRWVESDGRVRSHDELLRAALTELGFVKLGPRIRERLGEAVRRAHARPGRATPSDGRALAPAADDASDADGTVVTGRTRRRIEAEIAEIQKRLAAAPSAGADRAAATALRHSREQLEERLRPRLEYLQNLLTAAREIDHLDGAVTPGCVIVLSIDGAEAERLIIASVPVGRHEYISPSTTLGQVLTGGRVGGTYRYEVGGTQREVRILGIED